jgi:hypothetical protein
MKIAYITLHWPRTESSSIGKKIMRQTNVWRNQGHRVRFFSHLHPIENEKDLIAGERYFYPSNKGIIQREIGRIIAAMQLIKAVHAFQPDIIYLRWGMYTAPLRRLFAIAPVVLEINTNDKKEHRHLGIVLDIYNRLTRFIFLQAAKGMVFTSQELTRDPAFTPYIRRYEVIANGINLQDLPSYPAPSNSPPHLVFLGTPGMAWHGLDELIRFAEMNPDIIIDVVGSREQDISAHIPLNMNLFGYQQGQAFEKILAGADAAIGSISLHLNDMEEASPFKIRDCAGRGIPCILPYIDTDLSEVQSDAILHIPNTPDNLVLHGKLVHDFIYAMRGKRLNRALIAEKIDINQKEQKRVLFFREIVSQKNG